MGGIFIRCRFWKRTAGELVFGWTALSLFSERPVKVGCGGGRRGRQSDGSRLVVMLVGLA